MDAFAIQRMFDGSYVAAQPDTLVRDPHQAYLFVSRDAARQYIQRELPTDVGFGVARFPTTRPLP